MAISFQESLAENKQNLFPKHDLHFFFTMQYWHLWAVKAPFMVFQDTSRLPLLLDFNITAAIHLLQQRLVNNHKEGQVIVSPSPIVNRSVTCSFFTYSTTISLSLIMNMRKMYVLKHGSNPEIIALLTRNKILICAGNENQDSSASFMQKH